MGVCNHMWEFESGQGYNPNSNSKSYKCTLCGAVTTDNAIVERVIYQIKKMKDGAEGTIGEMLSPEKYGYTELAHICMMVCARAKAEGILLDSGDTSTVFLQYYDKFKKRERKRIVIKKVFGKSATGYKNGDYVQETIEVFVFDRVQVKYALTFCCDEKVQTQQTFNSDYYYDITRDDAHKLIDWCTSVSDGNPTYDMTNKTVMAPEHYGNSIVTINNDNYLLKSNDKLLNDLELLINLDPKKKEVDGRRKQFVGVGIPKVDMGTSKSSSSSGSFLPPAVGEFFEKLKNILTKPL